MMKANELRLGNKIYEYGIDYDAEGNKFLDKSDCKIIDVTIDVLRKLQDESEDYILFQPIALTPEILKRCGFVNRKLDNFYFFENGNLIIEGYESDYNGLYIGRVDYLHQLQNLYFVLKGEELTVHECDATMTP
jgi:hypothetical protein